MKKIGQISENRGTTGVMYNVKQRHYRVYNACRYSKTTDATDGAGNTYLPENMSSPRFSVVFMLLDLQFYVYCLVDHCLSFCSFTLGHDCVVFPSNYGF
jgi:hypothetical protein